MVSSYSDLTLVQSELRTSTSFSSSTTPTAATVNTWIDQESSQIDNKTGNAYASTTESSVFLDYDGTGTLLLEHTPLLEISELRYNQASSGATEDWVTLEEGTDKNYMVYLDEGEVKFIAGLNPTTKITPKAGYKKFCVTYKHGYSQVPGFIEKLVTKKVAHRVIGSLANSQTNTEGGDIQIGVIRVAEPGDFSLNYIKGLTQEIKELESELGLNFKTYRSTRNWE